MKYEITNKSGWGKAFKVFGGTHEVKNGATEIVDVQGGLTDEQIQTHALKKVTISEVKKDAPKFDREDLKKQADELELEYPANIKTEKLATLIDKALES